MLVKRLEIENIGPHKHFIQEFDAGLIGFLGKNGSGKSSVLNSMYAALTNDFSRFKATREKAILDTSKEKDIASIWLDGIHNDTPFEIRRGLRPNKSYLKIDGKTYTKVNEIKQQLEGLLNIQEDVIGTYLFVEQWKMFDFISQKPAERAEAFQHLSRTQRCEEIWKKLGELISELGDVVHLDADDNRKELKDRIAEAVRDIAEAVEQQKLYEQSVLSEEDAEAHRQNIANRQSVLSIKQQIRDTEHKVVEANKDLTKLRKTVQRTLKLNKEIAATLEDSRDAYEEALSAEELFDAWEENQEARNELLTQIEKYEDKLAESSKPEKPDCYSENIVAEVQKEQSDLDVKIKMLSEVIRSVSKLGKKTKCPTCRQDIEEGYLIQMEERLAELKEERTELVTEAYVESEKYEKMLRLYEADKARWQPKIDIAQAKLEAMEDIKEPSIEGNPKDWAETIETYEDLKESHDKNAKSIATKQTAIAGIEGRIEGLESSVDALKAEEAEITLGAVSLEESKKALAENTEELKELAAWAAKIELLNNKKQEYEKELKRKRKLITRATKGRKFVKFLERLREVSHRDNWPRVVSEINLQLMRGLINETMESFGNPFAVRPGDKLSLEFRKPGAPWRSASIASGGEKMILAIAFRRALNSLFGVDIGILGLDEPTAGVDVKNVECLREVFETIGSDARKRHGQVFIVTHEPKLESCFDQVVNL